MSNVFLIGMPGCGKSSVADVFAEFYGEQSFDLDAVIQNEYGDISRIFAERGEEYFRGLETQTLKRLCEYNDCFIATGGGCAMRAENVEIMKANGVIVYLRAREQTLLNRLKGDTTRPLLFGDNGDKLKKMYRERTPVYERIADIIVDTDSDEPEEIIKDIFKEVDLWQRKPH